MRFSATQWIQHLPVQNMDLGKCEVYGSALMFLNLYFLTCFCLDRTGFSDSKGARELCFKDYQRW